MEGKAGRRSIQRKNGVGVAMNDIDTSEFSYGCQWNALLRDVGEDILPGMNLYLFRAGDERVKASRTEGNA